MVYLNDPRRDEPQSALVYSLRDRYLAPGGTMIPDRVRYVARACEWPAQDYPTRRDEVRARITQLEGWYGLRLSPLTTAVEEGCWHAQFPPKRPDGRLALEGARLISPPTSFVEIDYRAAPVRYPDTLEIVTSGPGLFNALVWTQEIWYGEQLLFANESVSWVRTPKTVGAGSRCTLRLGDEWRRLNLATIAESR
jgi:hypothetical protein